MPEKETRPEAYSMAGEFLADHYICDPDSPIARELWLRWWRDEWYVYDGGCYSRIGLDELKAQIVGCLHEHWVPLGSYYVNCIVMALTHLCLIESRQELNSWLDNINGAQVITAMNGNVSLTDRDKDGKPRLLPHTAKYFSLSRLPYDYDPAAQCPLWLTFLGDVLQGDQQYIHLIQEWCGYLFRPDLRQQKFLLCVGEGPNGKGVFFEVVEALVGRENCSQVPLTRFASPFALYTTLGKVLNATNESSHTIEEEAETILKAFVVGDRFTFERKFKEPVDAVPTAKVMIATNALPRFTDKTEGIWRRILLVPFNRAIPEDRQVKGLAQEIIEKELAGILNWTFDGLRRLNGQNGFTIPERSKDLMEEYRQDADPARAFLLENYTYSPNAYGDGTEEVYSRYREFCTVNGYQAMNERTFGRHVRRIFPDAERKRVGPRDNRRYVYEGLVAQGNEPVSQVSQENPI
jgi:P4 family phage/plasmid primase-like protien